MFNLVPLGGTSTPGWEPLPVGIPYSLQKPKNPYRGDFSLRVATLRKIQVTQSRNIKI